MNHHPEERGTLTPELLAAYLSAVYRIDTDSGPLELRIGSANPAVQQLLRASGHSCAACITAFNPGGRLQQDAANLLAQRRLHQALQQRGFTFLTGRNLDPSGTWPPEASTLVLGSGQVESRALARRFGQLAFVWCDQSAVPTLYIT